MDKVSLGVRQAVRKPWPLLVENTEFCQGPLELQYSVYRKLYGYVNVSHL